MVRMVVASWGCRTRGGGCRLCDVDDDGCDVVVAAVVVGDFLETSAALLEASWSWLVSRGIFLTPGNEEQWTLSVQHDDADVDCYVEVFAAFCIALAA